MPLSRREVWEIVDQLASEWYEKLYCHLITHDRTGKCNPLTVWALFNVLVTEALKRGIEDPKYGVDWDEIIDPELTRAEVIEKAVRYFGSLKAEKIPLSELDEIAASSIDMEIHYLERALEEEIPELPPEERERAREEILKRLAELKAEREKFFAKVRRNAGKYRKNVVKEKKEKAEKRGITIEQYLRKTLDEYIKNLPEKAEEKPPKPEVPPPPKIPKKLLTKAEKLEVEMLIKPFALNLAGIPEKKLLPGFPRPVWVIPVRDEATGRIVYFIAGYPTKKVEPYPYTKITIVNKKGERIQILTFKEEVPKIVEIPKTEEVEKKVEEVSKEFEKVRGKVPKPPQARKPEIEINWDFIREFTRRLKRWISAMERYARERQPLPIYTYLTTILEFTEKYKTPAFKETPVLRYTPKQVEELWRYASRLLDAFGMPAEEYREEFMKFLRTLNVPYERAYPLVEDWVKEVVARAKARIPETPSRVKFSWRYVEWGLANIKLHAVSLQEAIKAKDVASALRHIFAIRTTAEKLLDILQQNKEVRERYG